MGTAAKALGIGLVALTLALTGAPTWVWAFCLGLAVSQVRLGRQR